MILSRLKPVETIQGKLLGGCTAGVPLRKALIVLQFAIVLFMISCTLIISKQLRSSMDTFVMVIVTISVKSVRAALANPVLSLKNE